MKGLNTIKKMIVHEGCKVILWLQSISNNFNGVDEQNTRFILEEKLGKSP